MRCEAALIDAEDARAQIAPELDQANTLLAWREDRRVEWHYIAPGKPTDKAFIESFNGKFRCDVVAGDVDIIAGCSVACSLTVRLTM